MTDAGAPAAGVRENRPDYIYVFEILHQYPSIRSFISKRPLKRSFMDSIMEMLVGTEKKAP
jgi:hypothetical protein